MATTISGSDSVNTGLVDETDDAETEPDDALSDEAALELGHETFKLSAERENENRLSFIDNIKFGRIGGPEQWPKDILDLRTADGKPCLSINRIPAMIHQVINDTRQNKPAIAVKPVDSGADRHTAEIMSGLIRHIENISNADAAYDTAVDNSASGGFGYFRYVIADTHDDSFDQDIKIERIADPLTVYGDPYSMGVDSTDWNDGFIVQLIPLKTFKKRWKGKTASDFDEASYRTLGDPWRVGEEVLVCEWWHREEVEREIVKLSNGWVVEAEKYDECVKVPDPVTGAEIETYPEREMCAAMGGTEEKRKLARSYKVTQRFMTGVEILETNAHPGRYIPIVPVYGEEVVVEGKRIFRSLFQDAKDPQRNFNYWRSKASEAAALGSFNPFIGPESAFTGTDAAKWGTINRKAHAYVSYPDKDENGQPIQPPTRQGYTGPDAAALQEAASASDDIKSTSGIYDASLGQRSNETSGRAINARKVEGDTGTFHFADNLSRGIRCLGVGLVDLIPHVYTPGRIVRVLGIDGVEHHVELGEKQVGAPGATPAGPGGPVAAPGMPGGMQGLPTGAPMPQQAPAPPSDDDKPDYGAIYDLGLGKYDVVVSAGPGYTTRRQEAADQMMQFLQAFPAAAPIIGDLFADSLDWPKASEIAARLRKMLPPQLQDDKGAASQIPPQVQAQIEQGKHLIEQLMAALKDCQAQLQAAEGDNKTEEMKAANDRLKIEVEKLQAANDAYQAQTDRMKAETERGQAMMTAFSASVAQPTFPQARSQQPMGAPR